MESNEAGPTCLVRGTKTPSIIRVEELESRVNMAPACDAPSPTHLVEPHIVSEMGVPIEFRVSSIRRSTPIHVPSKDVDNAMLDFLCNFAQIHVVPATGGAFDLEFRSIVLMEALKRFYEQEIGGEPDRT